MKEYDLVELIKMRPKYEKAGLKIGDFGAVMSEKSIDGEWYVIFSEFYTGKDIADLCVKEEDLKVWDKLPEEKLQSKFTYLGLNKIKKYDLVKLNNNILYQEYNLQKDMRGIVVDFDSKNAKIMFFNPQNTDNYVIIDVKIEDLVFDKEEISEKLKDELLLKIN